MLTAKGRDVKDYACLSTDSKPINAANGSILIEMDTQKVYIFDEQNATWREL